MTTRPILRPETILDYDHFDPDAPPISVRVFVVEVGTDRYEFADFPSALDAFRDVTAAVNESLEVFPCSWIVPRFHPEPDSPSDLLGPCGAPSFEDADGNGWHCLAGHGHRSGAEYYEEEEVAGHRNAGIPLAANARLMDGREIR